MQYLIKVIKGKFRILQ